MATPDELVVAANAEAVKYFDGLIEKAQKGNSGQMIMSGYASTLDRDLANEVILPSAFEKFLPRYQNNPIYCYNHDKSIPIGKVNKMTITDKGLYFDEIELAPIPIVKDVLWPLVKGEFIKQQSIGAIPIDGYWRGNTYYHTLLYTVEGSLVSVAMNPEADLDAVKHLGFGNTMFKSVDTLVKAYSLGMVTEDDRRKVFGFSDGEIFEHNTEETTDMATEIIETPNFKPDFSDVKAVQLTETQKGMYDLEGTVVSKPTRINKNFETINALTHAGEKIVNGSKVFMFEIADPTAKGFKYNFEKSIVSLARILGIKGSAVYNSVEKSALIDRICDVVIQSGHEESVPLYIFGVSPVYLIYGHTFVKRNTFLVPRLNDSIANAINQSGFFY
jgi:HK97 family phage prohead protease